MADTMIDPLMQYELIKRHMQDIQADAARRTHRRQAHRTSDRTAFSALRTLAVSWSSLRRAGSWGPPERVEGAVRRLSLVGGDDAQPPTEGGMEAEACSACASATGTYQ